jgi:uncharacterized protein (TIGR00725 family)
MKIAVCGHGENLDPAISKRAFEIGLEIAEKNILLLTGAGAGYPYEAVKGATSINGNVFGISPAANEKEHQSKYFFPIKGFTKIEYTGMGIPGRNLPLVKEADAVIIISGKTGTLNEFTIAFHYGKPIGILKGSKGITELIGQIAEICNKNNEKENIVYSSDPKELIELVINKL